MPFHFRLERVLRIKEAMEERLQQELAAAERRAKAAGEKVKATRRRLKEREEQLRALRSGRIPVERIRILMDFIDRLKRELAEEESRLRTCLEEVESSRAALVEAVKDRKTLEILKERDFAAYRENEKRRDQRAMDEMAQNVFIKERRTPRPSGDGRR